MNWIVLAGVALTFATACVGLAGTLRNQRQITQVHVLVNSQLHAVLDRVSQLTATLEQAGVDVPPRPDGGVK